MPAFIKELTLICGHRLHRAGVAVGTCDRCVQIDCSFRHARFTATQHRLDRGRAVQNFRMFMTANPPEQGSVNRVSHE